MKEIINKILKGSFIALYMLSVEVTQAQDGVGIGRSTVHSSAVLQVHSTGGNKGVLLPVVSSGSRNNIRTTAADGLLVYDDSEHVLYQKNGGSNSWQALVPVPKGAIIMWSGTSIPYGWTLCDGTNDTPDLRGRFIVGYKPDDTDYNQPGNYSTGGTTVGDFGGVKEVKLTTEEMPGHTHAMSSSGSHSHDIDDPGHTHLQKVNDVRNAKGGKCCAPDQNSFTGNNSNAPSTHSAKTGIVIESAGSHSHTNSNAGGSLPHENRPPYYTLAFIMKTL